MSWSVGSLLRGCGTARLDGLLHGVIRPFPACGDSRMHGLPEYYHCSYAQRSNSSNSRPERGPELRRRTKWSRRGSLCKVRQDAEEKLAFAQQVSGRTHIETWAGGCQSLKGRCAVSAIHPRTPFVTPVLPGSGSDTRMKMGWKILTKTEKSGVWFFQNVGGLWESGAADWVRKGSYHTAWAVPCGSSCSCSYAYGRGPAIGSHAGERCWPLLAGVWRAVAPLMKPWCAEGEVPTAANLNLYRRGNSCVRWHCDDEPLFGGLGNRSALFQ